MLNFVCATSLFYFFPFCFINVLFRDVSSEICDLYSVHLSMKYSVYATANIVRFLYKKNKFSRFFIIHKHHIQ